MADPGRQDVTLNTLHEDLRAGFADVKGALAAGFGEMRAGFADLKGEMRAGFADLKTSVTDLKATLVAGFRGLPSRESSEEMVRLLRESNRLQETRFTQLDARIREQHLETQQVLHALVEGHRRLVEGQEALVEGQRLMTAEIRSLSADIKALIARIDALIKRRDDGGSTA